MSQVETVAGTIISISATTPATFDQAGYTGSGMNFDAGVIGEITDAGDSGREYALVTHMPIASRGRQIFKGSFSEGGRTFQLAVDNDDAGQVIAKAALLSDNNYSFKIAHQGGDVSYFQAKVMSYKTAVSGVDTIRSATMQVEITTNSAGVGVVEVNV
jgi:hypothetical protein